ncbi:MAG: CDP-glycerol glycerophosphotransferase family protein, partial [Bacteroidaceae bacterium]|nr:CDP-glycerol glycerophosphotransferase family protein [Bacteroidaceae bacterium]
MNRLRQKYKEIRRSHNSVSACFIMAYIIGHKLIEKIYVKYLQCFGKIDPGMLIFESSPDYTDNSRALSDYLVSNGYLKKYKIFWSVADAGYCRQMHKDSKVEFLQNVDKYGEHKLSNIKKFMTAGTVFGTHNIVWSYRLRIPGQRHIRLWHGCGYKEPSDLDKRSSRTFDYGCVIGPMFVKVFSYYWNVDEQYVHPTGFARFDWLIAKSSNASAYRERTLDGGTKLLIWMPTFRNDKNGRYNSTEDVGCFPLIPDTAYWEKLDNACQRLGVKILLKIHMFQKDYSIDFSKLHHVIQITNQELDREGINLYELLAVTDGMITDYSSVAFDYLLVDKPLAFALDDYENYTSTRGFVFDDPLQYMPGH